jgi:hypothetical protein
LLSKILNEKLKAIHNLLCYSPKTVQVVKI